MTSNPEVPHRRKRDRFFAGFRKFRRSRDPSPGSTQDNAEPRRASSSGDDERSPESRAEHLQQGQRPHPSPSSQEPSSPSSSTAACSSSPTSSTLARPEADTRSKARSPPAGGDECSDLDVQERGQPELRTPTIRVEDYSNHHHGNTYNTTHIVNGTANFVGSATNSSFGGGSVIEDDHAGKVVCSPQPGIEALLWDSLPKQRDVSGLESNSYLEGSREDVVVDIFDWIEAPSSELAMFIYGPAGLGKSTLARHLTHRLHAAGRLAASVSLGGIPIESRGPESVVKLISREIGEKYKDAIPAILCAIQSCKGAPLKDHFKAHLCDPVCSLNLAHPLVVLFDAVDEWASHRAFIEMLPHFKSSSLSIKFILLGRSDPRTRGFEDDSIRPYLLQPVSADVMEQYLRKEFDSVHWDNEGRPPSWRIAQLAKLVNGLFIWAAVVCSLLQKRLSRSSPNDVLNSILDAGRGLGDNERLATLYHRAIVWLFPDSEDQELFREYLGATLALQEPLPLDDFAGLTNLPIRAITRIQADLKVLQIGQAGNGNGVLMVYPASNLFHLSFLEYLQSPSTPARIAFHIPLLDSHSQLAICCLTELPCFLPSSHSLDTLALSPQRKYTVMYLATHISLGSPPVRPDLTVEWEGTRLHHLLQQISIEVLLQWRFLLIELAKPGSLVWEAEYSNDGGALLFQGVADALGTGSFQVACLEVAIRFQPEDIGIWGNLGWAYHRLAEESRSVDASSKAVIAHQIALDFAGGDSRHDQGQLLFALATSLHAKFELVGHIEELDRSIALHRAALVLRPPGHSKRAITTNNLAASLHLRSKQADSIHNLNEAICLEREVLEHHSQGHLDRADALRNLAASLHLRSHKAGSIPNIDEAICLEREVLKHHPQGHPDHTNSLRNLSRSLYLRCEKTGSIPNINEVIHLEREVLKHCPQGHPDHAKALEQLAVSLHLRCEKTGSIPDIDEAICLTREVLEHRPQGHPGHADALRELAVSLRLRSEHAGSIPDVDEAVRLNREVLEHRPQGHPDHADALRNLAVSLHLRYEKTGSIPDINEAVRLKREVIEHRPQGHPDHADALWNLAVSLHLRSEKAGLIPDIDEAIPLYRVVLEHCPQGHPHHVDALRSLAVSLHLRSQKAGSIPDIDEAIRLERQVLENCPQGHPDHADTLRGLAVSLHLRSQKAGSIPDIDEAIPLYRKVLVHRPQGHPDHADALRNLANSLYLRCDKAGSIPDIDEATPLYRVVLEHRPQGHPDHAVALRELAGSLWLRFLKVGSVDDLIETIRLEREVLELHPPGHKARAKYLSHLAMFLRSLAKATGDPVHREEADGLEQEARELRSQSGD